VVDVKLRCPLLYNVIDLRCYLIEKQGIISIRKQLLTGKYMTTSEHIKEYLYWHKQNYSFAGIY